MPVGVDRMTPRVRVPSPVGVAPPRAGRPGAQRLDVAQQFARRGVVLLAAAAPRPSRDRRVGRHRDRRQALSRRHFGRAARRPDHLVVAGRDCTDLVEGVLAQAAVVRRLLSGVACGRARAGGAVLRRRRLAVVGDARGSRRASGDAPPRGQAVRDGAGSRGGGDGGRRRAARAPRVRLVDRRRDVLVQPEDVVRVVRGLDRRQPLPRRARVGGADALLALVAEEAA